MLSNLSTFSHGGNVMIKISEKPNGLWKCKEYGISISELLIQPNWIARFGLHSI